MIHPVARLPDRWIDQAEAEGAHIDFTLKSPWQLFASFEMSDAFGFVGLLLTSDHSATVRGWYVFPEHRGKGHGSALLRHALAWCASHGYVDVEIRTAHKVDWAGFKWSGYQRKGGNQERHYTITLQPALPLGQRP
jgi:GNAT superfamily N-acetyltransferase